MITFHVDGYKNYSALKLFEQYISHGHVGSREVVGGGDLCVRRAVVGH